MTNSSDYLNELYSLEGKVALVTGGHRGIGKMIADGLSKAGCRVYVAARSMGHPECPHTSIQCDLSSIDSIESVVQQLSEHENSLHILVNNAGYFSAQEISEVTVEDWNVVMDINIRAPFFLIQKLLPLLSKGASAQDPARVVSLGSIAGAMGSSNLAYVYGASKAALHQLTRNLAADLTGQNININAIVPGYFPSDMTDGLFSTQEGLREAVIDSIPRKRLGSKDDIAGMIIALCSPSGGYVSGAVIPLDGGVLLT